MSDGRPSRLWLWFLAACLLHAIVWAGWFTLAARHPVADVPLAGRGNR
jgi:hypothetical protein